MKKVFTLLTLALMSIGTAWAATETIHVFDGTNNSATVPSGAIEGTTSGFICTPNNFKSSTVDVSGYTNAGSTYKKGIRYGGGTTSAKNNLIVAVPNGFTASIDIVYSNQSGSDTYFGISTDGTKPAGSNCSIWNATASQTTIHTATIDNLAGNTTYYIGASSDQCLIVKLDVTITSVVAPTATAKWDWQNNDLSDYNVDALNGTKDITISGLTLHVCAAIEGTTVKLTDNGTYAQMNENTEIQVPVQSISDVVTVVAYPGQHNYTVGGVAATSDNTNHTATMKEVAQGYVSIVATSTAYLYNIEVKQYAKAATPALQSFTAGETTYYADEQEWTESPTGTFSTTIYVASVPATAPTAVAYNGTLGSITYDAGVATIPVTLSEATATYKVTFSASKIITVVAGAGGTVDPSGEQPAENGGSLTITATPNSGYAFLNWTKASDGSWSSTTNPLTIENITANDTYTANFKQLYKATYAQGDGNFGTTTKVTTTEYAGIDDQITLWDKNYYLGKNGYTLTGWNDGTNSHALGEVVTLTGNATMTAEYTANAAWLDDSQSQTVVTWAFSANPYVHVENATGYYVQQATINGNSVDIPMYITSRSADTGYNSNGKFATSNGQVQARYTKLTIPAIKGMTVVANAKSGSTYIFRNFIKLGDNYPDGSTTEDAAAASATYTYNGENGTVDICIYGNTIYLSSIVVTYPKHIPEPADPTTSGDYVYLTTSANMEGWRTFFDETQAYTVDENTTVYVAQTSAGKINVVSFTGGIPANTPVILHTSSSADSYKMTLTKVAALDLSVPTNILKATTAASTDLSAGTYRLGYKSTNGVGFYSYSSATAPAGIVYILKSDVTGGGAPGFLDFFIADDNTEGGEATGIDAVEKAQKEDGVYYNVNGQRVAQPTKGLYIVNGRKVVIK